MITKLKLLARTGRVVNGPGVAQLDRDLSHNIPRGAQRENIDFTIESLPVLSTQLIHEGPSEILPVILQILYVSAHRWEICLKGPDTGFTFETQIMEVMDYDSYKRRGIIELWVVEGTPH